jgi:hypothetical protein
MLLKAFGDTRKPRVRESHTTDALIIAVQYLLVTLCSIAFVNRMGGCIREVSSKRFRSVWC